MNNLSPYVFWNITIIEEKRNKRNRNYGEKNHIYYGNKKNEILRNKFNQRGKRLVIRKIHNTEERN